MFYQTQETVDEYIRMAEGYDGSKLIDAMLKFLPQGKLLELGSGSGNDIPFLLPHYDLTASDYSPYFLAHIQAKYPDVKTELIDAKGCETSGKFDGIYSNKVLQHLTAAELAESLRHQSHCLCESGIVCHSFWAGSGHENHGGILHQYYSEEEIKTLLAQHFTLLKLELYTEMQDKDSILAIAQRK